MSNLPQELQRVRERMLLQEPFFASFALRMEWEFTDAIPTAATDGRRIMWSPEFWGKLSEAERIGVCKHEVGHIINKDHIYRQERDTLRWNVATDHRINLMLLDSGQTLPKDAPADKKYAGGSAPEIYAKLPLNPLGGKGQGKGEPGDGDNGDTSTGGYPGDMGQVLDMPGAGSDAEQSAASREIDGQIIEAAKTARMCGKGSPFIDRLVVAIHAKAVDWRAEMRPYFTAISRDEQSWSRVQRRNLWRGLYLPTPHNPACATVGLIVDTSGSVGDAELGAFLGEIESLILGCRARVVIMGADDRVQGEPVEIGPEDIPLTWRPKGRGGTDFRPGLRWFVEHRPDVSSVIYLTDLEGPFPDAKEIPFPVLWVSVTDHVAPFGRTVRMRV